VKPELEAAVLFETESIESDIGIVWLGESVSDRGKTRPE